MSVSIITCPGCNTLLLSDTASCPTCEHVLNKDEASKLAQAEAAKTQDLAVAEMEDPCPKCGVMVRNGLVRCWKCGSFMRTDVEERFQELQTTPQKVLFSEDQQDEEYMPARLSDDQSAPDSSEQFVASDNDFELAANVAAAVPAAPTIPLATDDEPATAAQDTDSAAAESGTANDGKDADEPAADAKDSAGEQKKDGEDSSDGEDHSVATSGDVLLNVALEEEAETVKRRKKRGKERLKDREAKGLLVFCPRGHRIEVQEHHAGRTGKCPKCKQPFVVPFPKAEAEEGEQAAATKEVTLPWMHDVHLHKVDPEKLKLKAGSLKEQYEEVDALFSEEGMRLATLGQKKGGLFGGGGGKDEGRESIREHLSQDMPLMDLPAGWHEAFSPDTLRDLKIAQPAPYVHESVFAGVDVFGEGMVAIRLPSEEGSSEMRFLSFGVSEFRKFVRVLEREYQVEPPPAELGIPMATEFSEVKCHYSEDTMRVLKDSDYYVADPNSDTTLAGYKCQSCGLVVSEDSRKKEKIGGKAGKGLAKAKCPKCGGPFGREPLYSMEEPAEDEDKAGEEAAES